MKAKEILSSLNIPSCEYTIAHCSKLANIYQLFKEIKNDITEAALTDAKPLFMGKTVERYYRHQQWQERTKYQGIELPGQTLTVKTANGFYLVTLPLNTPVFYAFCELLNIPHNRQTVAQQVKGTISTETDVLPMLKKAVKFVSKDDLRPAMQHVSFRVQNGKLQISATNAHYLYYSNPIQTTAKDVQILIPANAIAKMKGKAFDVLLMDNDEIQIAGISFKPFTDAKFPDYSCVIPEYDQYITFNKEMFVTKVKQVAKYANQSTKQVNFHLNGKIEMSAQDVDFDFESTAEMPYINKNLPDMDVSFAATFLQTTLSVFKSKEVKMYHNGVSSKAGIFAADNERVLLMPLLCNR